MNNKKRLPLLGFIASLFLANLAWAHGDGADHAKANLPGRLALPVAVATSERFEIVARLLDDELSIYIDDWATNQPVGNATVEIEFAGKKATAAFHTDHGDYSLSDADMLKALHGAGEHALIFSVTTPDDADLLTGSLHVPEEHSHALLSLQWPALGALALAVLALLLGGFVWWKRNHRSAA